jgi:hypothetical protein
MSEAGHKTNAPYTAAKVGAGHNIQVNGRGPGYFATSASWNIRFIHIELLLERRTLYSRSGHSDD